MFNILFNSFCRASLQCISEGALLHKTGNQGKGVANTRDYSLIPISSALAPFSHMEHNTLQLSNPRDKAVVQRMCSLALQVVSTLFYIIFALALILTVFFVNGFNRNKTKKCLFTTIILYYCSLEVCWKNIILTYGY